MSLNVAFRKWNDPAIIAENPDLASILPDATIKRVVRSESSGTTEVFTSALAAFASDNSQIVWTLGTSSLLSKWPNENSTNISKQKGSSGVSDYVFNNKNTIAYNTAGSVITHLNAKIKNRQGNYVAPTVASCSSAMNDFIDSFDSRFTVNLVNAPGANSYPISSYSYLYYRTSSIEE